MHARFLSSFSEFRFPLLLAAFRQYNAVSRSQSLFIACFSNASSFGFCFQVVIMADSPTSPSSRFKAEMPNIPGVGSAPVRHRNPLLPLIVGVAVLGVFVIVGMRFFSHPARVAGPPHDEPAAQIEVPPPPPDPNSLLPHVNENNPAITEVATLAQPWSSQDFFIRSTITGESLPATVVRLPGGSASAASAYWAFSRKAAYGNCQLEYITDLDRLLKEYQYHRPTHPLVGNPCSHTLYDPLRTVNLPGNVWIRGAIVQGADIRPPLAIEVKVQGKELLAVRTE